MNIHFHSTLHTPHSSLSTPHPSQVLLRALRDFNLGKLTADDRSIFMGLLNDLFPGIPDTVPQAVDVDFNAKVLCR